MKVLISDFDPELYSQYTAPVYPSDIHGSGSIAHTDPIYRVVQKVVPPPHLYSVINLPSKTHTADIISMHFEYVTFWSLLKTV